MKLLNAIVGVGLSLAVAGAFALSLGSGRGAVVLGMPLDVTFELRPDPGADVAASCVAAKVVAGDAPIGDTRVRVTPVPQAQGRPAAVRVQTTVAIDEPVLLVTLSAGCNSRVTRTYTFLPELPAIGAPSPSSAAASPTSALNAARLPSVPFNVNEGPGRNTDNPAVPPPAPGGSAGAGAAAREPAVRAATPRAPVRSTPRARASVPDAPNSPPRQPRPSTGPRLVVEPLELWLDQPVTLRASTGLLVAPSEEPSAQREQAAALWKSLNATPEEAIAETALRDGAQVELAAARTLAQQERDNAAQAQQELARAMQERLPATWVYALGGLLLAALLLAVWLWARLRTATEKAVRAWRDSVAAMGGRSSSGHPDAPSFGSAPDDSWTPPDSAVVQERAAVTHPLQPLDTGAAPLAPTFVDTSPTQGPPATPAAARPAPTAAPARALAKPRAMGTEDLFDIQQQADFFVSVGEHQQAIEVLRTHIAERGDVSPLAYLELLRLYHTLSRVDEFNQLRRQFIQSFNAHVPEFAGFHRTGRMLYHYTEALARIEAEWTSPTVLALLGSFLFRSEGSDNAVEPFDLAAYDELLLLMAIAQTTPANARGKPGPRERTTPLPPPAPAARADATVLDPASSPSGAAAPGLVNPAAPDSRAAALDFEFDDSFAPAGGDEGARAPAAPAAAGAPAAGQAQQQTQQRRAAGEPSLDLDLDLTDPPHLTLSDLPPVPATPPPAAGQAVGFGMDNDLMELRLELEQKEDAQRRR